MKKTSAIKKTLHDHRMRKGMALLAAVVILAATPCQADAVSGNSGPGAVQAAGDTVSAESGIARSSETWAQLRDNRLEWAEIQGLVEEYSPTVLEERKTYRKNENRLKDATQTSKALLSAAGDYESLADAYEAETGGQVMAAEYRLQAEKLREQAADNTGDGRILQLGMEQAVVKEKKNVRDRFVTWYEAKSAQEENDRLIRQQEQEVKYAKARQNAGLSTASAVTAAQNSLSSAKGKTLSLETAVRSTYRDLIVSCGWKYNDEAEIGALPAADTMVLNTTEEAQGEQIALEKSFTLREDRYRLENAIRLYGESAIKEKSASRLAADTEDVRDAYLEAKEALKIAGDRYAAASSGTRMSEKNLEMAKKQLNAGKISGQEYQKKQAALEDAKQTQQSALYTLIRARSVYDAVLEGLT